MLGDIFLKKKFEKNYNRIKKIINGQQYFDLTYQ
jgi:hypothetical protein